MIVLIIVLVAVYMLFAIPAFMFTWEGEVFDGIGCSGWFCMLVGFPGALLALVLKGIIKLIQLPIENKRERIRREEEAENRLRFEQNQRECREREEKERIAREQAQRELYESYITKYSNSPVTREVIDLFNESRQLPYLVVVKSDGLTLQYEGVSKAYVFRAHGFPEMTIEEETYFAKFLNLKLNRRYTISEKFTSRVFEFPTGVEEYKTHISTEMKLNSTRTF